jgi:multiple sugar transport system permease protein
VQEKPSFLSTGILILGALYCLFPVIWVLAAASKDGTELFSTFTLAPNTHLWDNIVELTEYRDGLFWRWMAQHRSLRWSRCAIVSTWVSALSGYVLAKYDFPGQDRDLQSTAHGGAGARASFWRFRST